MANAYKVTVRSAVSDGTNIFLEVEISSGGHLCVPIVGFSVDQPQNLGYVTTNGPLGLWGRTVAQMNTLAPATTGQLLYVSDATSGLVPHCQ